VRKQPSISSSSPLFLARWRVTVYLIKDSYGLKSTIATFFLAFRLKMEQEVPLKVPGLKKPGVK
jgi:hypothetical protein